MKDHEIEEQYCRLQIRRARSKAGKASAASLTPEQRKARSLLGVEARKRNAIMRELERKASNQFSNQVQLPTAAELTGSDPDLTGDMSTDEFIRSIRGRPAPEDRPAIITCPVCSLTGYSIHCATCGGTGQHE